MPFSFADLGPLSETLLRTSAPCPSMLCRRLLGGRLPRLADYVTKMKPTSGATAAGGCEGANVAYPLWIWMLAAPRWDRCVEGISGSKRLGEPDLGPAL